MIKRLLLSLFIIIGAGGSVAVGTHALLNDSVTLTANAFSTGSVDLQIAVGDANYSGTHAGFTDTVMPGQTKSKSFKLKNNGSGVDLAIAAQAVSVSGLPADKVFVSITPWTSSSTTSGVPESGAVTTTHTLADWASGASLGNPNIGSNNVQDYKMDVRVDESVNTSGTSSFDFIFTGTQVNPQ